MKDREQKLEQEQEKQQPSRIIIESLDGTVKYLDGEDAAKWSRVMGGLVKLGFIHGKKGKEELGSLEWKSAASIQDIPTAEVE